MLAKPLMTRPGLNLPKLYPGEIMRAAIVALPDENIRDVVAYITQELAVTNRVAGSPVNK